MNRQPFFHYCLGQGARGYNGSILIQILSYSFQLLFAAAVLFHGSDISAQIGPPSPKELPGIGPVAFGLDERGALGFAPLVLRDGTVVHHYIEGDHGSQALIRIQSKDGGDSWSQPERVFQLPSEGKWAGRCCQPMIDREDNLHLFLLDFPNAMQKATWHTKFNVRDNRWTKLKNICPSISINAPIQLDSGRIVMSTGYFFRNRTWNDPIPHTKIATCFSDDGGESWERSRDELLVRPAETYHGIGVGGHEPVITQLRDGTVWMLIRTQTGWLYESFSKDGAEWSDPQASRFRSSDSPGSLVRLPSGELVLFWNNCDSPLPVDGRWIYTGRDALHAAISADDGKTWRGFREVYLDPFRNESRTETGDRGTAYPNATATREGQILLIAGQGKDRYKLFRIDPAWLKATHHEDNFAQDLESWSVFKSYGPVVGYSRNRVAGAQRIPHPSKPGKWVLHLRRPDEKSGDGAAWNFPTGRSGKLKLRILLRKGFGGGLITFTDRFIYPDDADLSKVVFALTLGADGHIGKSAKLEYGRWHILEMAWRVELDPPKGGWPGQLVISLDGREIAKLPQLNRARSGLSYLRLHSTAVGKDPAGFLIEHVTADVGL